MTPRPVRLTHTIHLGLLHAAALLVPGCERAEWLREWRAELWHARAERIPTGAASWRGEREMTAFCLGAFRDALSLRHNALPGGKRALRAAGSPMQCLFWMAAVLCAGFAASLLLPGVRAVTGGPRYRVDPGLVFIRNAAAESDNDATVSFAQFRRWTASRQRYFDKFTFYRIASDMVTTGSSIGSRWQGAHAGAYLFSMLGVPLRFAVPVGEEESGGPRVILSCALFERQFAGDAALTPAVVRIGEVTARFGGVAPCGNLGGNLSGELGLPGKVDAWLLDSGDAVTPRSMGYMVAHLNALGQSQVRGSRVWIGTAESDESGEGWVGVPIEGQPRGPWDLYCFAVFLALLALPAVTSVTMAEASFSSHKPDPWRRFVRIAFLCAKVALLLPVAWSVPVDLAYWPAAAHPVFSQYEQLVATFCICLFGARWVLADQRRRCPVCLRRVSNPAQVGDASRNFLAWNGTEMICRDGHTLLHVPGLPTSWFSTQRWLYLDSSWDFLFAGPSEG